MALRRTRGVLAVEGVQTSDGRLFREFSWVDPPIPFGWLRDQELHGGMGGAGAVDVGNITSIERVGNEITFTGHIDDEIPDGAELIRRLETGSASHGNRFGVSVDMDNMAVEIVTNPDSIAAPEEVAAEESVVVVASAQVSSPTAGRQFREFVARERVASGAVTAAAGDPLPEDGEILFAMAMDEMIEHYTRARIIGAVALPAGAFQEAFLELDDSAPEDAVEAPAGERAPAARPVTAAAAPVRPPRAWYFEAEPEDGDERLVPQYDPETGAYIGHACPLTILDTGQFFGHLAPAERCHVGYADVCVTAPRDLSDFHIGRVQSAEGDFIDGTGVFVVGTNHASHALGVREAMDYYAHTGTAWADGIVHAGRMGGWCCGSLRPGVTDELVRTLNGGGISGDWRGINTLSLISVLGVNAPGYPIQRVRAVMNQEPVALTAGAAMATAGEGGFTIITPPLAHAATKPPCGCGGAGASHDDMALSAIRAELAGLRSYLDHVTAPMRAEANRLLVEQFRADRRG